MIDSNGKPRVHPLLTSTGLRAGAFASGVWLLQQQAALPGVLWIYALVAASFANALLSRREAPRAKAAASIFTLVLCLAAGFLHASLRAQLRLADQLPSSAEGEDLRVTGVIVEMPQRADRGTRFVFDVESVATPNTHVPARVSLTWYPDPGGVPVLSAGQRWQLLVRLRRPHGTANPHGFDAEWWLLERGIRATGYVRPGDRRLLSPMVHRPLLWVERLREQARARITAAVSDASIAGVLTALAIGDQQAISARDWQIFTRTGVNHLMSISGLHITMFAGIALVVVRWAWPRLGAAALRVPTQKAAAAAGLIAAAGYALLAGFSVPAQRTVYMLGTLALAMWVGRPVRAIDVLAAAVVVVLIVDPWAVLAAGFWLSFGAVALIMYVSAARIGRIGQLRNWVQIQGAITIGLMPLTLAMFQQISVISPLANAFAIPLVSLGVVPLTLLGLSLPIDALLALAGWLTAWCNQALTWLGGLPSAVWEQHAPVPWSVWLATGGTAWLLAPRGWPARWIGCLALLPLFLVVVPPPRPGEAWIDVLDVGQGLAVVVRTQHHALVYDTGASYSADSDSGSRIVVPHLRASGIGRLDVLVVSHADSDHAGGMRSVLAAMPVDIVMTSFAAGSSVTTNTARCAQGQQWDWDGVLFTILHPHADGYNGTVVNSVVPKENDLSCVLRIEAAGQRVLLPGDIEHRAESELLARYSPEALRTDVLVVPHHGSSTSSTGAFVERTRPKVVVFTVGYRNRFGHPAGPVVDRYAQLGAQMYRSDRDGAILLKLGSTLQVDSWRRTQRNYWQGQ